MKNTSKTPTVPPSKWMFFDPSVKDLRKAPGVKIKFGELSENDISDQVYVLGISFRCGGEFKKTGKYSQ